LIEPIIVSLDTDSETSEDESEDEFDDVANECCVVCGEGDSELDKEDSWLGCDHCHDWFHQQCLGDKAKKLALESVQKNLKWHCNMCIVTKFQKDYGAMSAEEEE